jgi:hypothetical protein
LNITVGQLQRIMNWCLKRVSDGSVRNLNDRKEVARDRHDLPLHSCAGLIPRGMVH